MGRGSGRRRAAAALALAIIAGQGAQARACEQAPEPFTLQIEHGQFGDIGWHAVDFRCADGVLVVESDMRIEVKILLATAYRREAEYREVWDGDQLIEFEGTTVDDGETYEVSARLEGDKMIVEGASGRIEAPPGVVPDHPWNEDVIDRPLLFDVRDGYLIEAKTTRAGEKMIAAGGGEVVADRYVTEGELERELWYAKDGRLLQWRLERAGGTVTLKREPG